MPSLSTSRSQYNSSNSPRDNLQDDYPLAPQECPLQDHWSSSQSQHCAYKYPPQEYNQASGQVLVHGYGHDHSAVTSLDTVLTQNHRLCQSAYPIQQVDYIGEISLLLYPEPHKSHIPGGCDAAYVHQMPPAYPAPFFEYTDPRHTPAQIAQLFPPNPIDLPDVAEDSLPNGNGTTGTCGGLVHDRGTTNSSQAPSTRPAAWLRPRPEFATSSSGFYLPSPLHSSSSYPLSLCPSLPPSSPPSSKSPLTSTSSKNKKIGIPIPHPYARLQKKKDEAKRRKIWNHALEKDIFSSYELSTVGALQRRKIYIASLEGHIDRLHARLLELGFWPVNFSELEPFKGLNSKTAKSMVSGLEYDASWSKLKLLELERANGGLEKLLSNLTPSNPHPIPTFNTQGLCYESSWGLITGQLIDESSN